MKERGELKIGGRNQYTEDDSQSESSSTTLKKLKITPKQSSAWQAEAAKPVEQFEEEVAPLYQERKKKDAAPPKKSFKEAA